MIETFEMNQRLREGYYKTKLPYPPYRDDVQRKSYQDDQRRLNDQFMEDAIEAAGLKGNPKADKVWAKAWDLGHSAGHGEVWSYLTDLAELVL